MLHSPYSRPPSSLTTFLSFMIVHVMNERDPKADGWGQSPSIWQVQDLNSHSATECQVGWGLKAWLLRALWALAPRQLLPSVPLPAAGSHCGQHGVNLQSRSLLGLWLRLGWGQRRQFLGCKESQLGHSLPQALGPKCTYTWLQIKWNIGQVSFDLGETAYHQEQC